MNKSLIAAMLMLSLVFTACGGSSKSETTSNEENTEATTTAPETTTETPKSEATITEKAEEVKENAEATKDAVVETVEAVKSEVLSKYETLVNEVLPLAEKVKKGDIKAIAEYTKKSKAISDYVQKNATELTGLTGDDAKKYKELAESLVNSFKK